jgi:hypothetical protein
MFFVPNASPGPQSMEAFFLRGPARLQQESKSAKPFGEVPAASNGDQALNHITSQ